MRKSLVAPFTNPVTVGRSQDSTLNPAMKPLGRVLDLTWSPATPVSLYILAKR